jgi:hypothetical protein
MWTGAAQTLLARGVMAWVRWAWVRWAWVRWAWVRWAWIRWAWIRWDDARAVHQTDGDPRNETPIIVVGSRHDANPESGSPGSL